ncbi:hypothetical protein BT96DRAFT_780264, partial [Gymnopus androsaceus JB14]
TQQILKFAGRIIFHISASNWKVVFQRLHSTDLSVLGHSVLDRPRLLQVMNELSLLLVNMRAHGHKAIAGPLRSAIWTWIEHFPDESNKVVTTNTKMEGAS